MPTNALVIYDEVTGDVLRVVVPDNDAQLEKATFHGEGEGTVKVALKKVLTIGDLRELKSEVLAARKLP